MLIKDHRELFIKVKHHTKRFNLEFRKSMIAALTSAFGMLAALTWNNVIVEFMSKVTSLSPFHGKLISAIIVSILSVLGIILATNLFSPERRKKIQSSLTDFLPESPKI